MITTIYHVADLHIRCDFDGRHARRDEYCDVFSNLVEILSTRQPVLEGKGLLVVVGDIFEDKRALTPPLQDVFLDFITKTTALMPVVMIPGNHDIDQRHYTGQSQDRIEHLLGLITAFGELPNPVRYLNTTGVHKVCNVAICTVAITDMLSRTAGSGNVAVLPRFPQPEDVPYPDCDIVVALVHSTVTQIGLVHSARHPIRDGSSTQGHAAGSHGCSLAWFGNHRAVMLGDNHVPGIVKHEGVTVAQPGSILSQTFGEPTFGHGFIEWEEHLGEWTTRFFEIPNDCGAITLAHDTDGLVVALSGGLYPLHFSVSEDRESTTCEETRSCFDRGGIMTRMESRCVHIVPMTPRVRLLDGITRTNGDAFLRQFGMRACSYKVNPIASAKAALERDSDTAIGGLSRDIDIRLHLQPEKIKEFIRGGLASHTLVERMCEVIDNTSMLLVPNQPYLTKSKMSAITKANQDISAVIRSYAECLDAEIYKISFKIVSMDASWMGVFQSMHINFDGLSDSVTLLEGANGYGKSTVFDVVAICLYGDTPGSRSTYDVDANQVCKFPCNSTPNGTTPKTKIVVDIGNTRYSVHRSYIRHNDTFRQVSNVSSKDVTRRFPRVMKMGDGANEVVTEGISSVRAWVSSRAGRLDDVVMSSLMTQVSPGCFLKLPTHSNGKGDSRRGLLDKNLGIDGNARLGEAMAKSANLHKATHKDVVTLLDAVREGRPPEVSVEDVDEALHVLHSRQKVRDGLQHQISEVVSSRESDLATLKRAYDTHPSSDIESLLKELDASSENEDVEVLQGRVSRVEGMLASIPSAVRRYAETQEISDRELKEAEGGLKKLRRKIYPMLSKFPNRDAASHELNLHTDALDSLHKPETRVSKPNSDRVEDGTAESYKAVDVTEIVDMKATVDRMILSRRDRLRFSEGCASCRENKLLLEVGMILEQGGGISVDEEARATERMELSTLWWKAFDAYELALITHKRAASECKDVVDLFDSIATAEARVISAQVASGNAQELHSQWNREAKELEVERLEAIGLLHAAIRNDERLAALQSAVRTGKDARAYGEYLKLKGMLVSANSDVLDASYAYSQQETRLRAWEGHKQREDSLARAEETISSSSRVISSLSDAFNNADSGYLRHVYNNAVLPHLANKINVFLSSTESFFIVVHGGELMARRLCDSGKDVLPISINNIGGSERFVLELAVRCALQHLGTPGFNWKQVFVDEGFVAFDSTRLKSASMILGSMINVGRFEQIILTSHLKAIKDTCGESVIQIVKQGSLSQLM